MGYPHVSKHILEKRRFVESLTPGMEVSDLFLIAVAQQAQAKNGPYWRLEFRDAHGSISGKIWSPQSQNYPEISPGIALVTGRVTSYRDQPEIAVDSIRPLTAEESAGLDLSLFMPAAARSPHDMLKDLGRLAVGALSHEPWKRFVAAVLADPEIARALPTAPAAKAMHHAYVGGLLEHTLSVCGLCMRLCDHYPALDRQTLFAGALCHDLGKIWELSPGLVADYTTQGRLIGHMSIALERLAPLMHEAGLEPEYADHLRHLILSHHGTREFGSPVLPATAEALALHYADNVDAKLNQIESTLNTALGTAETGWSAYVPALERTLYRAPKSPEPENAPEADVEAEPDFEFGPLLYDDRLCEEFDPNFHLNDMADFPEFLFDDSDALPEKTFLPAEASAKSQTPPPPASVKAEASPESPVEAAASGAPKADESEPSPSPTEAQRSDTTDSEAAASAASAAQPETSQVEASLSSDTAKPAETSDPATDEPVTLESAPVAEAKPETSLSKAIADVSTTETAPERVSSSEAAGAPEPSSAPSAPEYPAAEPTDDGPAPASAAPTAPAEAQASETGAEASAAAASEASPAPAEPDAPAQASPETEPTEAAPAPKKKRAPRGARAKAAASADKKKPVETASSDPEPVAASSSEAGSLERQTDNALSSDPTASAPTPSEAKSSPAEAPAPAGAQADAPALSESGEDPAASPPKKKKAAPKIESLSLLG